MSNQSYADSGGVQIFHAGTAGDSLVPEYTFDSTAAGISTLVAAANRYTVTAVCVTVTVGVAGSSSLTLVRSFSPAGTGSRTIGYLPLVGTTTGNTTRWVLSIDLLPGENISLKSSAGLTGGRVVAGWEGYSSKFGDTEVGSVISKGTVPGYDVINGTVTYVDEPAVVRSAPLIGQSE